MNTTRKSFLVRGGLVALAATLPFGRAHGQTTPAPAAPASKPQLESPLVKRFVGSAHGDLAAVQEMLATEPGLINSTWDWGNGDFETALGAASHMGRAEIAEFLLGKGARLDLFAAAMLGKLDIVRAAIAAYPNITSVPGPHGIPLLAHAEKGGAPAAAVADFLRPLVRTEAERVQK